ncbi:MAG: tRNA 2-selenouridine synthase [Saprospiraceae bacterium]
MSTKLQITDNFHEVFTQDLPLLDVRAPVEFEQGAFPRSKNHPILDNDDHHEIGIEYKKQGQDAAILLGEDRVSGEIKEHRIASWLSFVKQNPQGALYCFRGGLRSRIAQQWIYEASGVDYPLLQGGYKALRRYLIDQIEASVQQIQPIVLSGRTGVGKTELLVQLENTVDLEGLANHRGSTFGRQITAQPTQINYENALAVVLIKHLSQDREMLVFEDEGPNIGSIHTPITLFNKTSLSPCVLLEESLEKRVQITLNEYVVLSSKQYIQEDENNGFDTYSAYLLDALSRVQRRLGSKRYNAIRTDMLAALKQQQNNGDVSKHQDWIAIMLRDYYDPMYDYQIEKKQARVVFSGNCEEVRQYLQENID